MNRAERTAAMTAKGASSSRCSRRGRPGASRSVAGNAPRAVCRRTLTQHDLLAGLDGPAAAERIALADHVMDVHGAGHLSRPQLPGPYGIPYGCLLADGCRNLLIASRGAGFTAIAASSARLTRTVMQLGQAAGTAAALALGRGLPPDALTVADLQATLRADGVQLDHPLTGTAATRVRAAEDDGLGRGQQDA